MNKKIIIIMVLLLIILSSLAFYTNTLKANSSNQTQITDMLGRNVEVPLNVSRVASLSNSVTVQVYMLAPDKLIGWDSNRSAVQNRFMPTQYQTLPVLGGGKKDANYETFISMNPDLVFVGHGMSVDDVNDMQDKLGLIPLLDVEGDNNLTNIDSSINFIGKTVGEQKKASELVSFHQRMLSEVVSKTASIPENEKKRVYYARDSTGLMTNPSGSAHTQLIDMCGGINVAQVPITKGSVGVSIEQVLIWNPDIIIASDPTFYQNIYSDPLWQNVKAVKDKQVYLVPNSPFNWFENPPGANTIIGIPWTAKVLYPDKFSDLNLKNITQEFYSSFYYYNLTDDEANSIITSSGLKS
ncbi:ABC transporter substrate-binding protein [Methanobacterium formicicum]|uniref:ABC transporter substrate-binding protein n=1 Tax=Methanobacterium formicicum (strain DSM 3637 / PP1) TaxID=1204725 RepID=K2R3H8_METFP|nr:ABC transporter substrate-binding protein [Methanobacterium formicicum]EKF87103.1 ABC transporter substrate-binding protein [Methanobacterium formicicum DSM 3637]